MIKELTYEEAEHLRQQVLRRFRQGFFQGAGIRISQYKKSYEPLALDIARTVSSAQASVTAHRLRKLFYYTDPGVCEPGKLEKPSFGIDFIEALFKYIGEADKPALAPHSEPFGPSRRLGKRWLWVAVFLLLGAMLGGSLLYHSAPEAWSDEFNSTDADSLKSRGWFFLDYDSVAFSRQQRPGFLTLYTYPGDYWVKKGETPFVKNLLVRKLPRGEWRVTFRLVGFDPDQNWQQAGMLLLDENLDRQNFFRVSLAFNRLTYAGYQTSNGMTDMVQQIEYVLGYRGMMEENSINLRNPGLSPPMNEVGVLLHIKERNLAMRLWHGNEWSSIEMDSKQIHELPFTPAYVGLFACQGQTNDQRLPLGADTMPAYFDYIRLEPLRE